MEDHPGLVSIVVGVDNSGNMFVPTLNGKAYCDSSWITEFTIDLDNAFTDCESLPGLLASARYNKEYDYTGPLPSVPISIEMLSCGDPEAELTLTAGDYHYSDYLAVYLEDSGISILFEEP